MTRARFAAAREVFDAFPGLADNMRAGPTGDAPAAFIRTLEASETPEDALTFTAFALPRREAVWWACQCVRALAGVAAGGEDPCLAAAEAWVREPDDAHRVAALRLSEAADRRQPFGWLALAAAWSGGNTSLMEGAHVRADPEQTATAARVAILIALAKVSARERAGRLALCVDGGVKLIDAERGAA